MDRLQDWKRYEELNTRFHIDSITLFEWFEYKSLAKSLDMWDNPEKKLYNILVGFIEWVKQD